MWHHSSNVHKQTTSLGDLTALKPFVYTRDHTVPDCRIRPVHLLRLVCGRGCDVNNDVTVRVTIGEVSGKRTGGQYGMIGITYSSHGKTVYNVEGFALTDIF
ncbi:hypothetical protein Pcinc_012418 [Petrolisthes cinctipes]|uniref:Uncharacterized protein n=1 Tax=Petrolisthes cinctipes TaxID=88211 RepID=A0AAE1FZC5_PETCI|nr:hypothetical protein Pcinc_012418 [Petrolisthes cinctipes]